MKTNSKGKNTMTRLDQIEAAILQLASSIKEVKTTDKSLDARVTALEGKVSATGSLSSFGETTAVSADGSVVETSETTDFFKTFVAALNEEEVKPVAEVAPVTTPVETVVEVTTATVETVAVAEALSTETVVTPVVEVAPVVIEAPVEVPAAVVEAPVTEAVAAPVEVVTAEVAPAPVVETPVVEAAPVATEVVPVAENQTATATTY
jgi:hypothetical protein